MAMSSSTGRSPDGYGEAQSPRRSGAGDGRYLAGQAPDGEAVGPVGGDLHLQHPVGEGEVVASRGSPASQSSGSSMMPALLAARPSSASDRIMPDDATPRSLASLICHAVGHDAAREHRRPPSARRRRWALRTRWCAAQPRPRPPAHRQLVGVGMPLDSPAPCPPRSGRGSRLRADTPTSSDPLDLGAGEGQTRGELVHRQLDGHVLSQPG